MINRTCFSIPDFVMQRSGAETWSGPKARSQRRSEAETWSGPKARSQRHSEAETWSGPKVRSQRRSEAETWSGPKARSQRRSEGETWSGPKVPSQQLAEPSKQRSVVGISLGPRALRSQHTPTREEEQLRRISEQSSYANSSEPLPAVDTTASELCFVRVTQNV